MKSAIVIFLFGPFLGMAAFLMIVGTMGWMMDRSVHDLATNPLQEERALFWFFFCLFIVVGWILLGSYTDEIEDALS